MKDDPVIARIRETRHRISARFGHDPRKLVAHYMELEKNRKEPDAGPEEETPGEPSGSDRPDGNSPEMPG